MGSLRIRNSTINLLSGIGSQVLVQILAFICRTYFIRFLGTSYLGVNGLFGNILGFLNMADLGLGTAITFSLYKALADKDQVKIQALVKFYLTVYRIVAATVLLIGLSLIPFMNLIIKDMPDIPNLMWIYTLMVVSKSLGYLFLYKKTVLSANQQRYILNIYGAIFSILQNILQIVILFVSANFILYLLTQMLCDLAQNFLLVHKSNKQFPFLKGRIVQQLSKPEKLKIWKNSYVLLQHQIGGFILNSTDNLVIASVVSNGISRIGIYSNYVMILNMIQMFTNQVFAAIGASVGNLASLESNERSYEVFKMILFASTWIFGFCAVCLWILYNPFITAWIGHDFTLSPLIVSVIVLNFYLVGVRNPVLSFTNAYGIYWYTRWKPLLECSINLGLSIFMAKRFGMIGVFLGTTISMLASSIWMEPWALFKHSFRLSVYRYFEQLGLYSIAIGIIGCFLSWICKHIPTGTIGWVIVQAILCGVIFNISFVILFHRSNEFKELVKIGKLLVRPVFLRIRAGMLHTNM